MRPIASTRAQLFPEAHDDGPLEVHRPPRIAFSARAWYGAIMTMVVMVVLITIFDVVAGWVAPDATNAFLGGTGVTYDSDGNAHVIAGTWLAHLRIGAIVGAILTYLLLRAAIELGRRLSGGRRMRWADYGAQRSLRPYAAGSLTGTDLNVFNSGRDRDWSGMLQGRLRGGATVVVGATAWTTGTGKSQERHHLYFAYVRLPDAVAELFPGSSLTRFLRGISDVDLHPAWYEQLRFESSAVDDACEIRVRGSNDEVRWRELFDPITLVGLDELYDAQWQHVGRDIVFCVGGRRHRRAPAKVLDTLCLTAAFMHERFLAAASGDVSREQLAG